MLSNALIIPSFISFRQNVDTELEFETWCMTPTFCSTRSLRVAQTLSPQSRSPHYHSLHTRSPHSHALQELKDDLLDDTAWPVVMQ